MKWFLPCVSLVCFAVLGLADEPKWTKVESKDGKCQIEFPGEPKEKVETDAKSRRYILEAQQGKAVYWLKLITMTSAIPITQDDVLKNTLDRGPSDRLA